MSRDEAMRLMAGYLAMSSSINAVGDFGSYLKDDDTRKHVALVLSEVVALIYERGMRPIIAEFPDLDPDA